MIANYKTVKEHLLNGGLIKENDWYTLDHGIKLIDKEQNIIATVRTDTFFKLWKELNIEICGYTYSAKFYRLKRTLPETERNKN